jgi:hypothetical protein
MRWISSSCASFSLIHAPTESAPFSPLHPPVLQRAISFAADPALRAIRTAF